MKLYGCKYICNYSVSQLFLHYFPLSLALNLPVNSDLHCCSMIPYRHLFSVTFFVCLGLQAAAQTGSAIHQDTTYRLVGEKLLTNQDFSIAVGQSILIGKAAGEQGWYRTITFKSPTAWPLLLLRDQEISQNVEYQSDESMRERDKIRDILTTGDTLIVTKIKEFGPDRSTGKNWYVVSLRGGEGAMALNFRCYIIDAIRRGEVVVGEGIR